MEWEGKVRVEGAVLDRDSGSGDLAKQAAIKIEGNVVNV